MYRILKDIHCHIPETYFWQSEEEKFTDTEINEKEWTYVPDLGRHTIIICKTGTNTRFSFVTERVNSYHNQRQKVLMTNRLTPRKEDCKNSKIVFIHDLKRKRDKNNYSY